MTIGILLGSIPAMRVRYITSPSMILIRWKMFNSRYAGKIHLHQRNKRSSRRVCSIPAMRVRYIENCVIYLTEDIDCSIPAMRVRYITTHVIFCAWKTVFNSRYAGKIHQQKQRKTLPLTMASLCKTPFLLFIVYHICLHLSTFYPNFTDFVLIFRRRLVRVSSFSSQFYSGFSGSRTWPVPVPAQNAKDSWSLTFSASNSIAIV